MDIHEVFILTSEWLDEGKGHEIRLYGRSEALGPVAMVFDEVPPLFFVDRAEKLPSLDVSLERKAVKLKTIGGRDVDALYFRTWKALRQASERFAATGVRHYEADVRPADRFLMERFINGTAQIMGKSEKVNGLLTFRNPKIKAGRGKVPEMVVVSLDIETGVSDGQLYSIAVHLRGRGREEKSVFMLADRREDLRDHLSLYPSEKAVLRAFLKWFREEDPDLIIGWHVIGFDLMYLERKCREWDTELDLARGDRKILLTEKPGSGYFATISGRVVIDGPPALRHAGHRFPNFKLETVARTLLQTGKLITSDHNKVAEIERRFREDKPALARYNLEDCVLVTEIFEKTEVISLLVQRTRFSGLLLDQFGIAKAAFDHYYLPKLHRLGFVAENAENREATAATPWELEPVAGIYKDVVFLDLSNLYPSLIRTFKIEPLAHRKADTGAVTTPSGHRFSPTEHLLPELLERLMVRREEARKQGRTITVKAATIQLRVLCKVLHTKTSRFYTPELSSALQSMAQWVAGESRNFLEGKGYRVVRSDEDALFLALKENETALPKPSGIMIARSLGDYWRERLEREFHISSCLDIRYGGHYRKFVQPHTKGQEDGKCFAGLGEAMILEGMDHVISDWTEMARKFLREWFRRFFEEEELEGWLRDLVNRLKRGAEDGNLVYEKRIRKDLKEYAKNAPAHIRAARMLSQPGPRIRYLRTKRGPIPEALNPKDIDYEHYIRKQVRPIAELILTLKGKSFRSVTEPEQISLF